MSKRPRDEEPIEEEKAKDIFAQTDLDISTAVPSGPVECLGMTFPTDEARRDHFLKELAAKLKDPAFRKIEGFPIGEDEDILALSDPPYYTACPNPWLSDFIKHYGRPYDPKEKYHREPFAADVSEGKNHPIYNAHSYHTKVPHRAIMRYILHYTEPGDLVFDGFCGTGMTGVAAQLCGNRSEVQALGYRVQDDGTILNEEGKPYSKFGARRAILNDLSPAATFIAYNYNTPAEVHAFELQAKRILKEVEDDMGWIYTTLHKVTKEEAAQSVESIERSTTLKELEKVVRALWVKEGMTARVNYAVWADVFTCPECASEVNFWQAAVDKTSGEVLDDFPCQQCGALLRKRNAGQTQRSYFDTALKTAITQAKQTLVLINYSVAGKRLEKPADAFDHALATKLESFRITDFFPTKRMPDGDESRRNDPAGITHVHHFYSKRNLWLLANMLKRSTHQSLTCALLDGHSVGTKMSRFRASAWASKSTGPMKGNTAGTFYVPSLIGEQNWLNIFKEKIAMVRRAYFSPARTMISTGSAFSITSSQSLLDYVFIDPPFGANLMYSELNFLWESWLRVWTNAATEAVESKTQSKNLDVYRQLMTRSFRTAFDILKPGRWMTVEFSNTKAAVWNMIQSALQEAGFVVANVATLDKQQVSFKAVTTATAVKQDLIISAYKPNGGLEERFAKTGDTETGVWDFIKTHLGNLPVVKAKGGQLEPIAERDARILFDRTVAFYIQHGIPVPISSPEFQAGLAEKFPEREGMFFLPDQAAEYDRARMKMAGIGQLKIFVEDERSAVDWLRNYLKKTPSKYHDIQPEFFEQLSQSWKKWETKPELRALLDQYFLCYNGEGEIPSQIHGYLSTNFKELRNLSADHALLRDKARDCWFVPDPRKNADVEQLREKRLLEEFWSYLPPGHQAAARTRRPNEPMLPGMNQPPPKLPKGKRITIVRTEAIRIGFNFCFARNDYTTIIAVAQYIPDDAIQNDEQLQMIYDSAITRTEGELK